MALAHDEDLARLCRIYTKQFDMPPPPAVTDRPSELQRHLTRAIFTGIALRDEMAAWPATKTV